MRRLGRLLFAALSLGCDAKPEAAPTSPTVTAPATALTGPWRATLQSPGGELPFELRLEQRGGELLATGHNGEETVAFTSATLEGTEVLFRIDGYDSRIRATLDDTGQRLEGTWTKTTPQGPSSMPFVATAGDLPRFSAAIEAPDHPVPASLDGDWSITFREDDEGTFVGHAILSTEDKALHGTILTDTGDYRYLAGRYESGVLELSCFDGGHAKTPASPTRSC